MATAILNPAIDSISGAIGGIVLYERFGRTVMRAYIIPPNPRTPAQQANRSRFRDAMASWRRLPDEEKDTYNRKARKLGMTGHNLYISRYMKAYTDGNTPLSPDKQWRIDIPFSAGTEHIPMLPPLGVRGFKRYLKVTASADQLEDAGKPLTPGRYDEVSLTCSSHNPVRRQADTDNGSPSLHTACRSVTAPSQPAFSVYLAPTAFS